MRLYRLCWETCACSTLISTGMPASNTGRSLQCWLWFSQRRSSALSIWYPALCSTTPYLSPYYSFCDHFSSPRTMRWQPQNSQVLPQQRLYSDSKKIMTLEVHLFRHESRQFIQDSRWHIELSTKIEHAVSFSSFKEWSLLSSRPTSRAHDRSLCQGDPTGREAGLDMHLKVRCMSRSVPHFHAQFTQ